MNRIFFVMTVPLAAVFVLNSPGCSRSVAEETSAGKVTEPPASKDNRQPQPERETK